MIYSAALFVGEGSWDITQRIPRLPGIDEKINSIEFVESSGGVAANASVACARTGTASRALLRLGTDNAAGWILDSLADARVQAVADSGDGVTTRATILLEPHGEKRLLLFGGAGLYPSMAAVEAADLTNIRWVHTTLYDPDAAGVLLARCRAQQIPVSIDLEPGSFKTLDAVSVHLLNAHVVFANDRTHERLGDAAAALLSRGVLSVIRTRGPQGASWHGPGASQSFAAPAASIVDTTGAGDCLAGWFIGETIAGRIVAEAGDALCMLRRLAVPNSAPTGPIPHPKPLNGLFRKGSPSYGYAKSSANQTRCPEEPLQKPKAHHRRYSPSTIAWSAALRGAGFA